MATTRQIGFFMAIAPLLYYGLYILLVARWHHREVMFNAKYAHSERCICEEEHFWDDSGDRRKWQQHMIDDVEPRFLNPDTYTKLNVTGRFFEPGCQCIVGGHTDFKSVYHNHRSLECIAPPFREVQDLGGIHDAGTALFAVNCKPSCCQRGPKLVYTKQWKKREAEDRAKRLKKMEDDIAAATENFGRDEEARARFAMEAAAANAAATKDDAGAGGDAGDASAGDDAAQDVNAH